MSNKTRKHIWPVSLVMSIAIIGALAAFLVLATNPGDTQAHGEYVEGENHCPNPADEIAHDLGTSDHTCTEGPTGNGNGNGNGDGDMGDMIGSSSTSPSSTVKLTLTIEDGGTLVAGSSVELYLEDDFQVPDDIEPGDVYFVGGGSIGRVYATDPVEINDDDHFGGDDDWAIQVYLPDQNPDNEAGFDRWTGSATVPLQLVFSKGAEIKNPSEAGSHSVGYSILGPNDDANDGPMVKNHGSDDMYLKQLKTYAKIGLSDEDNKRGYELTITGSGFNNGVTAGAYVLHIDGDGSNMYLWDALNCYEMDMAVGADAAAAGDYCQMYDDLGTTETGVVDALDFSGGDAEAALCSAVVRSGANVGDGTVDSNDKVDIRVDVTVPTFMAGDQNYICMADGEGLAATTDVEMFHLEPSIRAVPSTVNAGDTVNVFAQDYPVTGARFNGILLAGESVTESSRSSIGQDHAGTASFEVPGGHKGTLRVDATWTHQNTDGEDVNTKKNAKITIAPSELNLSKDDVVANESITIRGSGFGTGRMADCLVSASISGAELLLISEDGVDGDTTTDDQTCIDVEVSSGGQFAATVAVWSDDSDNPALTSGTHTIEVEDNQGFVGTATITIKEPTLMVSPGVAGPRDYITISGENWPVDNDDGGRIDEVSIEIDFGEDIDDEDADPDVGGRWSANYRVDGDVIIPSTVRIKASYGEGSEIVKVSSFSVPQANMTVTPDRAAPGDKITLSATGFTQFESDISVKIGSVTVNVPDGTVTDRDGAIGGLEVIVPSLDAGLYTVQMNVGDPSTVTIGEVTVVEESAAGVAAELPGALSEVGDNLVAVFYWNDATKEWAFFDPRPEFAELNSLTELASGQAYWILVAENQDNIVLNGKSRSLTCAAGSCWNLEVW